MGFLFGLVTGVFAFVAALAIVVVHLLKINLDLANPQVKNVHNGTSQQSCNGRASLHDFSDVSETRLRKMIEKIIAETITISPLTNGHAVSEISLDACSRTADNRPLANNDYYPRHRTEHYFEPTIYQDLLATAVLNKIVDKQSNIKQDIAERDIGDGCGNDVIDNTRLGSCDQNFNVEKISTSSGSSVEPRSDCSYPEVETALNNNDDKTSEFLANSDRDSVMSDYLANHMIPLPDLTAIPTESEEDDYTSVTSSAIGDGTWEKNWLFKRKKSTLSASVTTSSIGMLVPDPKEDVRAQIGDKTADEVSDLSEIGSDSDESLNSLRSQLDPINDRLINKHIIGGQNSKRILDELIECSSMISNTLPNDMESTYTDACNEHIIDATTKNEAINCNVDQQESRIEKQVEGSEVVVCSAATEDLNSNSLAAIDDNSDFEGCTGFSAVEIIESTSRTPSVVEILAAMALGPMLAVPSLDQPVAMTASDFNALSELKDLALAEIKSRELGLIPHNLDVIPEEAADIAGNGVDSSNNDIETSQEKFQVSYLPLIQEFTEPEIEKISSTDATESYQKSSSQITSGELTETIATTGEENTLNMKGAELECESTKFIPGEWNSGIDENTTGNAKANIHYASELKYSTEYLNSFETAELKGKEQNQRDISESANAYITEKLDIDNVSDKYLIVLNKEKLTDKITDIQVEGNEDILKDKSFNIEDNLSRDTQEVKLTKQQTSETSEKHFEQQLDTTDDATTSEENTKQERPLVMEEHIVKSQHSEIQTEREERISKDNSVSAKSEEHAIMKNSRALGESLSKDQPSAGYSDSADNAAKVEESLAEETFPVGQYEQAQLDPTTPTANVEENLLGTETTMSTEGYSEPQHQQNEIVSDNKPEIEVDTTGADEKMLQKQYSEQINEDSKERSGEVSTDYSVCFIETSKAEERVIERHLKDVDESISKEHFSSIERVSESTHKTVGTEQYASHETSKQLNKIIYDEQFYEAQTEPTETVLNKQLVESEEYSKAKHATKIDDIAYDEEYSKIHANTIIGDYMDCFVKNAETEQCPTEEHLKIVDKAIYKRQFSETQAESFETASDEHSDFFSSKSKSEECTKEQQTNSKCETLEKMAEQTEKMSDKSRIVFKECTTEEQLKGINETMLKQERSEKNAEQSEKVSDGESASKNITKSEDSNTEEPSNEVDAMISNEQFYEAQTDQTEIVPNDQLDSAIEDETKREDEAITKETLSKKQVEQAKAYVVIISKDKSLETNTDQIETPCNSAESDVSSKEEHSSNNEEKLCDIQDQNTDVVLDDSSISLNDNYKMRTCETEICSKKIIEKVSTGQFSELQTKEVSDVHSLCHSNKTGSDEFIMEKYSSGANETVSEMLNDSGDKTDTSVQQQSEGLPDPDSASTKPAVLDCKANREECSTENPDETCSIQKDIDTPIENTVSAPNNDTYKPEKCKAHDESVSCTLSPCVHETASKEKVSETQELKKKLISDDNKGKAEECTVEEILTCIDERTTTEQVSKRQEQETEVISHGSADIEKTASKEQVSETKILDIEAVSDDSADKTEECVVEENSTLINKTAPTEQVLETQELEIEAVLHDSADKPEGCVVEENSTLVDETAPKEQASEIQELEVEAVLNDSADKPEGCVVEENSTLVDETAPKEQASEIQELEVEAVLNDSADKPEGCVVEENSTLINKTAPTEQVSETKVLEIEAVLNDSADKPEGCVVEENSTLVDETAPKEQASETQELEIEAVLNDSADKPEGCVVEENSTLVDETAPKEQASETQELEIEAVLNDSADKPEGCVVEENSTLVDETAPKEQASETQELEIEAVLNDSADKPEGCVVEENSTLVDETAPKEQASETQELEIEAVLNDSADKPEGCVVEENSTLVDETAPKEQASETQELEIEAVLNDSADKPEGCVVEENSTLVDETAPKEQASETQELEIEAVLNDSADKPEGCVVEENSTLVDETAPKEQASETQELEIEAVLNDSADKPEGCVVEENSTLVDETAPKEQASETQELEIEAVLNDSADKPEGCVVEENSTLVDETAPKEQASETQELEIEAVLNDSADKPEGCVVEENSTLVDETAPKEQASETQELEIEAVLNDSADKPEGCVVEENSTLVDETAPKEQASETQELEIEAVLNDSADKPEGCVVEENSTLVDETAPKEQVSETQELEIEAVFNDSADKPEGCVVEENSTLVDETAPKEQASETQELEIEAVLNDSADKPEGCVVEENSTLVDETAPKEQASETQELEIEAVLNDSADKPEGCVVEENSTLVDETAPKEQASETQELEIEAVLNDSADKPEGCVVEENSTLVDETAPKEQASETQELEIEAVLNDSADKPEGCVVEENSTLVDETAPKEQASETQELEIEAVLNDSADKPEGCVVEENSTLVDETAPKEQASETQELEIEAVLNDSADKPEGCVVEENSTLVDETAPKEQASETQELEIEAVLNDSADKPEGCVVEENSTLVDETAPKEQASETQELEIEAVLNDSADKPEGCVVEENSTLVDETAPKDQVSETQELEIEAVLNDSVDKPEGCVVEENSTLVDEVAPKEQVSETQELEIEAVFNDSADKPEGCVVEENSTLIDKTASEEQVSETKVLEIEAVLNDSADKPEGCAVEETSTLSDETAPKEQVSETQELEIEAVFNDSADKPEGCVVEENSTLIDKTASEEQVSETKVLEIEAVLNDSADKPEGCAVEETSTLSDETAPKEQVSETQELEIEAVFNDSADKPEGCAVEETSTLVDEVAPKEQVSETQELEIEAVFNDSADKPEGCVVEENSTLIDKTASEEQVSETKVLEIEAVLNDSADKPEGCAVEETSTLSDETAPKEQVSETQELEIEAVFNDSADKPEGCVVEENSTLVDETAPKEQVSETQELEIEAVFNDSADKPEGCVVEENSTLIDKTASEEQVSETKVLEIEAVLNDSADKPEGCAVEETSTLSDETAPKEQVSETQELEFEAVLNDSADKPEGCVVEENSTLVDETAPKEQASETQELEIEAVLNDSADKPEGCVVEENSTLVDETAPKEQASETQELEIEAVLNDSADKPEGCVVEENSTLVDETAPKEQASETQELEFEAVLNDSADKPEGCVVEENSTLVDETAPKEQASETQELEIEAVLNDSADKPEGCVVEENSTLVDETAPKEQASETQELEIEAVLNDSADKPEGCVVEENSTLVDETAPKEQASETQELEIEAVLNDSADKPEGCVVEENSTLVDETAPKDQVSETKELEIEAVLNDSVDKPEGCVVEENSTLVDETAPKEQVSETQELEIEAALNDSVDKPEGCVVEENSTLIDKTASEEQVSETKVLEIEAVLNDSADKPEGCAVEETSTLVDEVAPKEQVSETQELEIEVVFNDSADKPEGCAVEETSTLIDESAPKEQVSETQELEIEVVFNDSADKPEGCPVEETSTLVDEAAPKEQVSETQELEIEVVFNDSADKPEGCAVEETSTLIDESAPKEQVSETQELEIEAVFNDSADKPEGCAVEETSTLVDEAAPKEQVSETQELEIEVVFNDSADKPEGCAVEETSTLIDESAPKEQVSETQELEIEAVFNDSGDKPEGCVLEENSTLIDKTASEEQVSETKVLEIEAVLNDSADNPEECALEETSTLLEETALNQQVSETQEQQIEVISDDNGYKTEEGILEEHSTYDTTHMEKFFTTEEQQSKVNDNAKVVEERTLEKNSTCIDDTARNGKVSETRQRQRIVTFDNKTDKAEESRIEEYSTCIDESSPKVHFSELLSGDDAVRAKECIKEKHSTTVKDEVAQNETISHEELASSYNAPQFKETMKLFEAQPELSRIVSDAQVHSTGNTVDFAKFTTEKHLEEPDEQISKHCPFRKLVEESERVTDDSLGCLKKSDKEHSRDKKQLSSEIQAKQTELYTLRNIPGVIDEMTSKETSLESDTKQIENISDYCITNTTQDEEQSRDVNDSVSAEVTSEPRDKQIETASAKHSKFGNDADKSKEFTVGECLIINQTIFEKCGIEEHPIEVKDEHTKTVSNEHSGSTKNAPNSVECTLSETRNVPREQSHSENIVTENRLRPPTDLASIGPSSSNDLEAGLLHIDPIEHDDAISKQQPAEQLTKQTEATQHSEATNNAANNQSEIDYEQISTAVLNENEYNSRDAVIDQSEVEGDISCENLAKQTETVDNEPKLLVETINRKQHCGTQSRQLFSDAQSTESTIHDVASSTKSEANDDLNPEYKICDEKLDQIIPRQESSQKHSEHSTKLNLEKIPEESRVEGNTLKEHSVNQTSETQAEKINTVACEQYAKLVSAKCVADEESKSENMKSIDNPKELNETTFKQLSESQDEQTKIAFTEASAVDDTFSSTSRAGIELEIVSNEQKRAEETNLNDRPIVQSPESKTNRNSLLECTKSEVIESTAEKPPLNTSEDQISSEYSPTVTRQSTVVQVSHTSNRTDESPSAGNFNISKKLQRQCRVVDTTPSFEDVSPLSVPPASQPNSTSTFALLCQKFIHDKHLLTALENRRRRTLLMHRFLSTLDLSHSADDSTEDPHKDHTDTDEVLVTENAVVSESLTHSYTHSSDHDNHTDSFVSQTNELNKISYNFINTILFSDQLSYDSNLNDGSRTGTIEEYIENDNDEKEIVTVNLSKISATNTTSNATTNTSSVTNSKAYTNATKNCNHKKPVTYLPPTSSNQRHPDNNLLASAVQNKGSRRLHRELIKIKQIEAKVSKDETDFKDTGAIKNDPDDYHDVDEDDDDDVVAIFRHFVPGSIAEREYKKWYNAVEMPNNPYAPEALKRRISGSQERYIDLPNISPTKDLNPLNLLNEQRSDADESAKLENDYKRYSRDYYINSSLTTSQLPPGKDVSAVCAKENREILSSLSSEKEAEIDLYKAIPAQVIEDNSSLMETVTLTTMEIHPNITSASDDSDTIKINDSSIPHDIKKEQETVGKIDLEEKAYLNLAGKTSESGGNTMAPVRGSTPVALKFLQPKRKLLQPNQVLTADQEWQEVASSQYEKPVIEAEVVKALPSVKALARAFLMTTNSTQPEKIWLRKARTLSQGGKKRPASSTLSVDQVMQFDRLRPEDDVTISSDLSSLETDSCSVGTEMATSSDLTHPAASSATDPSSASATSNASHVPVRQGVLKSNIAFFENLKNK